MIKGYSIPWDCSWIENYKLNSRAVAHKKLYGEMLASHSVILAEAICTTIRPEYRVPTDLCLLFAHDHSTKIYGPLSFILSFVHNHSTKVRVFNDLFLLFVHGHSTRLYDPLSFILSFVHTIWPKIRVLINLNFLFVHDHSTKNEGLHWLIFFIWTRPFDQKLGSSLFFFFFFLIYTQPFYQN